MTALPVEVVELETKALAWPDLARQLVITDDPSFSSAGSMLTGIKDLRKEMDTTFDPIISKALDAHREAIKQKKRHEAPLVEAEMIIKRGLSLYRESQEVKRMAERLFLEAAARKREEERILAEAEEAEADGDATAAEEIISQPVAPPPVHMAPATPKTQGISFRETWQFQVVSITELVRHVAAHPEDSNLLMANTTAIRSLVTSRKDLSNIPGVKVWKESNVAAAGRR